MSGHAGPHEPVAHEPVAHDPVAHDPVARDVERAEGYLLDRVSERLSRVRDRITATGRDAASVRIVAVTKGFGAPAIRAAFEAGLMDIGENYASELLSKAAVSDLPAVRWHYIGAIQRRSVARLAPIVGCWETLCRSQEIETVARRAPGACVLIQVDLTDSTRSPSRSATALRNGSPPDEVPGLVAEAVSAGLDVEGLMAVGPRGSPEAARPGFRLVAELARSLGLRELSMGMTDDMEIALEEGSTILRVGRGLFGDRLHTG